MSDRDKVTKSAITVSAPGKALISGGYLVLERPNIGIVLAADKRFYATVQLDPNMVRAAPSSRETGLPPNTIRVDVHSPQFDTVLSYDLHVPRLAATDDDDDVPIPKITPIPNQQPNVFIEKSLELSMLFVHERDPQSLHHLLHAATRRLRIKVRADNDFYSQIHYIQSHNLEMTCGVVSSLPRFLPCPKTDAARVTKTGMGSSAALVTSLVGALLAFFDVTDVFSADDDNDGRRMVHNLAQVCHCVAQNKIGSGFDVSSAVYGSQKYVRFSPGLLSPLLRYDDACASEDNYYRFSKELYDAVTTTEWDNEVGPLRLPPGMELLMADVCGGSESPSMARKVMAWKKGPEQKLADRLWKNLAEINGKLYDALRRMTAEDWNERWKRHARSLSRQTASQWEIYATNGGNHPSSDDDDGMRQCAAWLLEFRNTFFAARRGLKEMGVSAGVPIEPDLQTSLADATMSLPGVVAAGVPGAGGYDALFCLYIGGDDVRERIGCFWSRQCDDHGVVCPLDVRIGSEGVRREDMGWDL